MEKQHYSSEKVHICTMHKYGDGTFLFTSSSENTQEVFTHGLLWPWCAYLTFSLQWPLQCSCVLTHGEQVYLSDRDGVRVNGPVRLLHSEGPYRVLISSLFRKLVQPPLPSSCPQIHANVLNCLRTIDTQQSRIAIMKTNIPVNHLLSKALRTWRLFA